MLSVTEKGFGVRSSAYGYRITGRGGQGINNMDLTRRSDAVVAMFPVGHNDQIMLVTDAGMVIRCPVDDIRIVRRGGAGRGDLQGRRRRAGRLGGAAARSCRGERQRRTANGDAEERGRRNRTTRQRTRRTTIKPRGTTR